ncbi:NYN domain-containing protein [Poseidonibacter lekithochrous]|uniref:NYN domain-containing protein n=1 Tax=Poseidonibacter TaxID=2321187 RepID=UPI001C0A650C|nr:MULTISPECIES: NYN domain-containing protein [Poseidonibacter]MBU3015069.1 NYN domain-containing protein [Poseidonibacter lekithochrous]MDO6828365.1 NYN domain-containing protein [Poseidonibacter sp. 1_MG-2023]
MRDYKTMKLAVLIDADNAQASVVEELLAEVAKFGVASIKRAYGDWTTTNLKQWKEHLNSHAIQPIQQFSYTQGKNATDASLIIDAMDILHENSLDGFCLISSDSDFTRLATRIRESGLIVYGFGEKKTPEAFIAACDKFVFTEILREKKDTEIIEESNTTELRPVVISAINAVSKDDGWARLSNVGAYINKKHPSFDPRNYGYDKLGKLIRDLNYILIDERKFNDDSDNVHIYIKIRD